MLRALCVDDATILFAEDKEPPSLSGCLLASNGYGRSRFCKIIGMCIGISYLPVFPLPFISFGSTSMIAQLVSGIVPVSLRYRTKAA